MAGRPRHDHGTSSSKATGNGFQKLAGSNPAPARHAGGVSLRQQPAAAWGRRPGAGRRRQRAGCRVAADYTL